VAAKIRVLVTHVPQLVRDVITHAIASQADMQLIEERIDSETRGVDPDVVIVGTSAPDDLQPVTSTLWRWPWSQVLMVTIDGRQSALYRLEPQRTALGELSPVELVEQIRSAARQRGHIEPTRPPRRPGKSR
jgi:DNA-binding NarL/FixJ family response regulator